MIRLRVKEIARSKGMSMGKLQRDADLSYRTVQLIYRDPFREVTTTTLGKIAKVLGVPPGELLEEVEDNAQD